jgi:hypothetical protein
MGGDAQDKHRGRALPGSVLAPGVETAENADQIRGEANPVRLLELEGWYMGGHPARKDPVQATLSIDDERMTVADFSSDTRFIVEPWGNVTGLFVEEPDSAETRVAATRLPTDIPRGRAALGASLWNLWWLKNKKSASFIVVQGTFGDFVFEVTTKSPERLRAKVALWAGRINGG